MGASPAELRECCQGLERASGGVDRQRCAMRGLHQEREELSSLHKGSHITMCAPRLRGRRYSRSFRSNSLKLGKASRL
jgi:hypothetical protein